MARKKVVIVGGGFAGLNVTKGLINKDVDVVLIDKLNHHLFQPLLYQVATAALSPADIATPLREIFKKAANVTVIMGEVSMIDTTHNSLQLKNGDSLSFDYLVLAVGAKHSYFGHSEWEAFAPGLKTVADAIQIREKILISFEKAERINNDEEATPYLNFVIIGGGPTGVEMAGAIAEIAYKTLFKNFRNIKPEKAKIYLLEGMNRILPVYPENLSVRAKKDLEKMGVRVLTDKIVTQVTEDGVYIGEMFIPSKNVIWAAGNQASALLKTLHVEMDRAGRVLVNSDLSIKGYPHIFVIGDAASATGKNGKPLPGIAPVAIQQGHYIAKIIRNEIKGGPRKPFSYFDKGSMATIGTAKAVAMIGKVTIAGFFAWLGWLGIHILYLVGYKNRFSVGLQWLFHYLSGSRGARLLYGSIDEELKKEPKKY